MIAALEPSGGLWLDVLSHLWQTTIVLAVLAAIALAMRRAPARLLNALWWIGLVKLLVPLRLLAPLVRRALEPLTAGSRTASPVLEGVTVWLGKAAPILDPARAARGDELSAIGSAGMILLAVWAAGAVWLVASWIRARKRLAARGPDGLAHLPEDLASGLQRALDGTRIPRSAMRVTQAPVMPSVTGVFRRRIIVPETLVTRLSTEELRAVLLHEDAHRRRWEPLQALVQRAAVAAFYFFPLLWPLLARLRETSEIACDEAAIAAGVRPSDYARALARTLSIGLEPLGLAAALAHRSPSLTQHRMERLRQEGRFVLMRRHWLCLAIAALAVLAIAGSSMTSTATEEDAAEKTDEAVEDEKTEGEEITYSITLETSVDPAYPEDAKKDGAGGTVRLKLTIEQDGEIAEVEVVEEVEEYPSLTEAAEAAVRQWTFSIEGGPEGPVEVIVPVEFKIDGKSTMELKVTVPDAKEKPEEPAEPEEPGEPEQPQEPDKPEEPSASEEEAADA